MRVRTPLLVLAMLAIGARLDAATSYTAATCENKPLQTDVQAAITSCLGDAECTKVIIPAGTCTWATAINLSGQTGTAASPFTVSGAGIGNTIILDDTGSTAPLTLTVATTHFVRLTGIEMRAKTASLGGNGLLFITGPYGHIAFHVDRCKFWDSDGDGTIISTGSSRIVNVNYVFGLFDHNIFDRDSTTSVQSVNVFGSTISADGGYTPWADTSITIGSESAVYFEDNVFIRGAAKSESTIEGYAGARFVDRFNTVIHGHTGAHGTDSGNTRGTISQEEYFNSYDNTGGGSIDSGTVRSAIGMYFGNTHVGAYTGITVTYYRATSDLTTIRDWGPADGTQYDLQSTSFSNIGSRKVTAYGTGAGRFLASAPDTVCSGAVTGDCTRPLDGAGEHGYPGRDQPGIGPGQVSVPLYEWNNGTGITWAMNDAAVLAGSTCSATSGSELCKAGFHLDHWVRLDRDRFVGASGIQTSSTSPFNGSTGVGWGTLANIPPCTDPAACKVGAGYWATDQGSWNESTSNPEGVNVEGADGVLYQWDGDSWEVYYTPYTYPHPLQGDDPTDTTPPVVSIDFPTTLTNANGTTALVVTSASDANGISSCIGALDTGATFDVTGTTSATAGPITLHSGANVIRVFCLDPDGNVGDDQITIVHDKKHGVLGRLVPRIGGE